MKSEKRGSALSLASPQDAVAWKGVEAQLKAAEAQTLTGYAGLGTLLIASVGLVKVSRDIKALSTEQAARDASYKTEQAARDASYKTEQAARDASYKTEQAARDRAAAAALNVTVLLLARQTPPTPPPLPLPEAARLTP
jgi:hypothetical protein